MRLLLVRHGQTPSNVAGLLDTALPGPGLTALGARQAAAIPDALADRVVDGVAVSTLVRTHLTASPLAERHGYDPVELDGFREVDAGALEMSAEHDDHATYLETVFAWGRGEPGRRMPGGPDGTEFLARYDDAVASVARTGWRTAVVVSHGAAIRAWACARAAGVDLDLLARTPLANTGLVEVEGDPSSGWRLVGLSDGPLGGTALDDLVAEDPTGESVDEEGRRAAADD
ncbi:histidine phosphatase family protein [Cellulosimicrobium sp. E-16]|uniref:histidine phosphatase family protein n=1 Tax=Cellulosimicrobium sp. E-16 TaxID=3404049 RepID=UPI003CEF1606